MNFNPFNVGPYLHIHEEPPALQKFIYASQKDLKTTLKCNILLNYGPADKDVHMICDVYRQKSPPLLSHHLLLQRHSDANKLFVIDRMTQPEPGTVLRSYTLDNFHILNVPKKKRKEILMSKLNYLQRWETGSMHLTDEQKLAVRNKVIYESYDVNSDDKIYLGFTAYIHDTSSNTKIKYAETQFSSAIYDCSNTAILQPFHSFRNGGSIHKLNMEISINSNIQIQLCDDNGWSAFATDVQNSGDSVIFTVPPYQGCWQDDTRLVQIKVLVDGNNVCKKPIRFLYKYDDMTAML